MGAPIRVGDYLIEFTKRLLQDALDQADPMQWERVAEIYDGYPCPRNAMIAQNCRNHAQLLREQYAEHPRPISPEVDMVVDEVLGGDA